MKSAIKSGRAFNGAERDLGKTISIEKVDELLELQKEDIKAWHSKRFRRHIV